jgi:ABC-type sugar transport system ATPase subunit
MVREPQAFLFDEPLSNLDPALRAQARAELLLLHRRLKTTMLYVTHDQEEAMTLAKRVAVMRHGVIEQFAAPLDVYAHPVNTFVAQFIGSPPMNLMRSPVPGTPGRDAMWVGVRPHDVLIGASGTLTAVVALVEPRGHDAVIHLRMSDVAVATDAGQSTRPTIVAVVPAEQIPTVESEVTVGFRPGAVHFFDREGRAVADG